MISARSSVIASVAASRRLSAVCWCGPARRKCGRWLVRCGRKRLGKGSAMSGRSALSAAARVTDPDYPGLVARLGDAWRVVVSTDCCRYRLQRRVATVEGERWVSPPGRPPSRFASVVQAWGDAVPGLVTVAASLPVDPREAAPYFALARASLVERFAVERAARAVEARKRRRGRGACRGGGACL